MFKLDTGADGTVISSDEPWLKGMRMQKPKTVLYGPGGNKLDVVGTFEATLAYKDQEITETAYVIRNQSTSLLSRNACAGLGLLTCHVEEVHDGVEEDLFSGLGELKGYEYEIDLKPGFTPRCIYTPRAVPMPLREKVRNKLREMEEQGVISRVEQHTEWCSGMVVVRKPSGDVRLCTDYTGLNKAVKREVHPMASVDDSLAQLGASKIFSKLDANSGFWQVKLSEKSKLLTTFLTPFGRFCYNRLPFGISSAPEIFQRAMSCILENVSGVICHMDDIVVHSTNAEDHKTILKVVLDRLRGAGITLNRKKCEFQKSRVKFLGHIIDEQGVMVDPDKTDAIRNFPEPTNRSELRRLNGLLNQLAKFIPNLATINAPLRELLKETKDWVWEEPQKEAFSRIKEILTSAQTMAHYDVRRPTVVATDASNVGLGATLFQIAEDGAKRPVMYASGSLSETETRYAVIEKEALGAVWACEKFDHYVRGTDFTLETDHRPLVPLLMEKDLDRVPARILRMRLRLMRYAPTVRYIQGSKNNVADALSRAPTGKPTEEDRVFIEEIESNFVIPTDPVVTKLLQSQGEDAICQRITQYCLDGWPTYKTDANTALHPYLDEKSHFTVNSGLLLYDQRVVVPADCRLEMLERIHAAHQGVVKCKARARRSVWWPGMMTQIKEMVDKCRTCRVHSPTPVEPLQPSTLPERPWQRLGADLFELGGKQYLLVVDYYSRWVEVRHLSSLSATATVESLKSILCIHGIPDCLISDNGPQFASREFVEFATSYGFTHMTSSPRYPQANGEAERAVKTVKLLWKKTRDPHMSLLIYRATPLANGYTPSELLMGRQIKTLLPVIQEMKPLDPKQIREDESCQRAKTKENFDRKHKAAEQTELQSGQAVHVRDLDRSGVVKAMVAPRSYAVETSQSTVRRNRSALIPLEDNVGKGPQVAGPRTPPVTQGAEVPPLTRSEKASPSGARVSRSNFAEGTGLSTTQPASRSISGKVIVARREPRERRMPSKYDDFVMD